MWGISVCMHALTFSRLAHGTDPSSAASLPTSADYAAVKYMEEVAHVLPWPSFTPGHRFRALTSAQLVALGQQYFASVPSSQNATAMALVIYDWYRVSKNGRLDLCCVGQCPITDDRSSTSQREATSQRSER
jgi:hypothetical protein